MLSRHARFGLLLFFIYLALYAGFVLISAFYPALMERQPIEGVNLAILYGFGLIGAAVVLALLYGLTGGSPRDGEANS